MLLQQRASWLCAPTQMSDALSRNSTGEFERIIAKCLVHARREFIDIREWFEAECEVVLEAISKVYKIDSETAGMSDAQRLEYHQNKSGPVMEGLRKWIEEMFKEKVVEPNSGLGKAMNYMKKHWKGLTMFLRVEGCPLDNNAVERALKLAVLNRKNAYFYRTMKGARVGDWIMSVIKTCQLNGVNVWKYMMNYSL
jgi:transposase